MQSTKTNIVVARYTKNTDFVNKFKKLYENIDILIYDKENPDNEYNIPINKGNEASVYLKYIIDFYNELPEFTFFIHDEEYAWHHSGSIIDKYIEAKYANKSYYNINDIAPNQFEFLKNDDYNKNIFNDKNWWNDFLGWYNIFIGNYVNFDKIDKFKIFRCCAQFLVHRDSIKKLPIDFYQNLYNWIITTDMPNNKSGRFMEWIWHIIWSDDF
jgi:hypothetical protein